MRAREKNRFHLHFDSNLRCTVSIRRTRQRRNLASNACYRFLAPVLRLEVGLSSVSIGKCLASTLSLSLFLVVVIFLLRYHSLFLWAEGEAQLHHDHSFPNQQNQSCPLQAYLTPSSSSQHQRSAAQGSSRFLSLFPPRRSVSPQRGLPQSQRERAST